MKLDVEITVVFVLHVVVSHILCGYFLILLESQESSANSNMSVMGFTAQMLGKVACLHIKLSLMHTQYTVIQKFRATLEFWILEY